MAVPTKGVIALLIGLMVTMLIGIVVVQSLATNIDRAGWSSDANTTWTTLQSNIWIAYALIVIIPIIVGAVAIMGYVRFG